MGRATLDEDPVREGKKTTHSFWKKATARRKGDLAAKSNSMVAGVSVRVKSAGGTAKIDEAPGKSEH